LPVPPATIRHYLRAATFITRCRRPALTRSGSSAAMLFEAEILPPLPTFVSCKLHSRPELPRFHRYPRVYSSDDSPGHSHDDLPSPLARGPRGRDPRRNPSRQTRSSTCCSPSASSACCWSPCRLVLRPATIPGITDIMIVVLAAQHSNLFLLIGARDTWLFPRRILQLPGGATPAVSASWKNTVPANIFKPVCRWMQTHAVLSVALPAVLPPPMPLSPFVLAAGALKMAREKFSHHLYRQPLPAPLPGRLDRRLLWSARAAHLEHIQPQIRNGNSSSRSGVSS